MITDVKIEGLDELLKDFDPSVIKKGLTRTINRVLDSTKGEAAKIVSSEFKINQSDVRRKITTIKAGFEPKGELILKGKPILLGYFKPVQYGKGQKITLASRKGVMSAVSPLRRYGGGKSGVEVQILRNAKKALLKRSWIGIGVGGTPLVFTRKGKERKPIIVRKVTTYPSILTKKENIQRIRQKIWDRWAKEIWSNLNFYNERRLFGR